MRTDIVIFLNGSIPAMTWMKDEKYAGRKMYSDKDKKKLEKDSGDVKAVTLFCNWLYRIMSW
jgi:hypothetical protein